jgi:hypothetical protein
VLDCPALLIEENLVGLLADHLEAEIFQERHPARQRHRLAGMEDLQREVIIRRALAAIEGI